MTIEPITIAGQPGFLVNGALHCFVELSRPEGAALSMYGCRALARAVGPDGAPMVGLSGKAIVGEFTAAVPKTELLAAPETTAGIVTQRAREGALQAVAAEVAVHAANAAAGI